MCYNRPVSLYNFCRLRLWRYLRMSHRTVFVIYTMVMIIFVISLFFPYQRFNIAIEYSTIIVRITGIVAIGMSVAYLFLLRR